MNSISPSKNNFLKNLLHYTDIFGITFQEVNFYENTFHSFLGGVYSLFVIVIILILFIGKTINMYSSSTYYLIINLKNKFDLYNLNIRI